MQAIHYLDIDNTLQAAWAHISEDRLREAMVLAKQAFSQAPDSPDVAHLLGLIASREGQHTIALTQLQKSIDLGGKSARKLRDMAEALYSAGHAEAALAPLQDAMAEYGVSSALLGLKSAIEIAMERWQAAEDSALQAISLDPNLLAWELNASFSQLIQLNLKSGFQYATARTENLLEFSRSPAFQFATPCEIWLLGEQGIGDTLFYLRYIPALREQGWQFHLQADRKLIPLLQPTGLFLSIKEQNKCPTDKFWCNVGDLALMAQQRGIADIPAPLGLTPDPKQVEKITKELAKFGPAPYIAVTWRGGPKGRKQRAGIRMLEKTVSPAQLGQTLSSINATIVNIQRLPILEETLAFHKALGRKSADYTALNNNLSGMLAMLSVVDDYITVSNTNLHLREAVAKPSKVFVNRPFQDWRWVFEGTESPWYPNSHVLRQDPQGNWDSALSYLETAIMPSAPASLAPAQSPHETALTPDSEIMAEPLYQAHIAEGWKALADGHMSQAIQKAQEILKLSPRHAGAHHLLGWAAATDFKYDIATGLLQQACALAPQSGIIVRDFIRAVAMSGKVPQALQIADAALADPQLNSKSAIHYAKAAICAMHGEHALAIRHYDACLDINPNYMDAMDFGGMLRMKLGSGHARLGFKLNSARKQCQHPSQIDVYCCPVLRGHFQGLKLLITRDMGLGDELTYLRYLPWLVRAGAEITYWCGAKLYPVLAASKLGIHLVPDNQPRPDPAQFDLAFIVSELGYAAEHQGAPEIAPPLPLEPDPALVEKWRHWLTQQGPGPYIGFNWRAGVAVTEHAAAITKLSKAVAPEALASVLADVRGTFISLQRNVTRTELDQFASQLNAPVADAATLTDTLDDLLALLSLLDVNVGVSNTNMHLRAGLGLASDVLVQHPGGDWRWGVEGEHSEWFSESTVYRQSQDGTWQAALHQLRERLIARIGRRDSIAVVQTMPQPTTHVSHDSLTAAAPTTAQRRIIWVSAGEITGEGAQLQSSLDSAKHRVIAPAQALHALGWQSVFVNEQMAEIMGGWNGMTPQAGDIVVFSKVITTHAITMMRDANQRGAWTVLDVFNDFSKQPNRAAQQAQLIALAHAVIAHPEHVAIIQSQSVLEVIPDLNDRMTADARAQVCQQWHQALQQLPLASASLAERSSATTPSTVVLAPTPDVTPSNSQALVWVTAGQLDHSLGYASSTLASTRYRVLLPAANLGPLGWQSQIVNEADLAQFGWGKMALGADKIIIVSKSHQPAVLPHLQLAKQQGCTVVVDFCDNHFERPDDIGQHQHALLALADHIVTSAEALQTHLLTLTQTPISVITDCFEGQKKPAKFAPGEVLKLLWFGSHTNHDTLLPLFKALAHYAQSQPVSLELVTLHTNGEAAAKEVSTPGLTVIYTAWNPANLAAALERCDLVVIPTLQSEQKAGKSANRLFESLWAGRYVVAGELDAYLPFAPYASIGNDLVSGIVWALNHRQQVVEKIQSGQAYIAQHHTPKLVGQLWHTLLSSLVDAPKVAQPVATLSPTPTKVKSTQVTLSSAVVVIAHYNQRGTDDLLALLDDIDHYDPGLPISLAIVVNDVTHEPLTVQSQRYPTQVFYRENTGMNIGAWDYGWRQFPHEALFIFLQDECRIIKSGWALAFANTLSDTQVGLVGESINSKWDAPWATLAQQPQMAARISIYQAMFQRWAVPMGDTGKHLRSLVWAARKETLQAIEGFHVGQTLEECIAAEIAVSKQIEARGMRIAQLSEARPFQCIAHTEWSTHQRKLTAPAFATDFSYGGTFILSQKHYTVKPRHDLFALIDHAPLSLCEIGCADGTNLHALASLLQAQGLKPTLVGVDIAKIDNEPGYRDMTFMHQTAESFVDTWQGQRFDLVILSDVIEHLYNPWQFMHKLRRLLKPGARVLMSVPNIQNLNYVHAIAGGGFHYQASGLFDVTHIRFFSVETLTMLIEQAGYRVVGQDFRPDKGLSSLREKAENLLKAHTETTVDIGNVRLTVNQKTLERFFSQQILLSCTPLQVRE